MTKKDYELIASVISKFPDKRIYKVDLVVELCKALLTDNEYFSSIKFTAACLNLDYKDLDAVMAEQDWRLWW